MASIQIFCTLDEMSRWLRMLCSHHKLASLTFRTSTQYGVLLQDCSSIDISGDTYAVFLFPGYAAPTTLLTMNEVEARNWGWIYVQPGKLIRQNHQNILLLTDIIGEDFEVESIHPGKYVQWLRRKIKGKCYRGVKIKSEDAPGERIIRDIWYSEQALALYRSGSVWKQFVDGKAFFIPVDTGGGSECKSGDT
jgi:hypothetical protein